MVESKAWNWSKASKLDIWKEPSIESYYLQNRWKKQMKKDFLDLGCGIGTLIVQLNNLAKTVISVDQS